MSSADEKAVKAAVEPLFAVNLGDEKRVELIVARAQEIESARIVADAMWPALEPKMMQNLDRGDPAFLERCRAVPPGLTDAMVSCLQEEAERSLPNKLPANKYTTGSRLTRIVENLVHYRAGEVQGAASKLFDTKQTDRFASVDGIRTRVISILFERCFQELNALPSPCGRGWGRGR